MLGLFETARGFQDWKSLIEYTIAKEAVSDRYLAWKKEHCKGGDQGPRIPRVIYSHGSETDGFRMILLGLQCVHLWHRWGRMGEAVKWWKKGSLAGGTFVCSWSAWVSGSKPLILGWYGDASPTRPQGNLVVK